VGVWNSQIAKPILDFVAAAADAVRCCWIVSPIATQSVSTLFAPLDYALPNAVTKSGWLCWRHVSRRQFAPTQAVSNFRQMRNKSEPGR
jgi:hypothetical protein